MSNPYQNLFAADETIGFSIAGFMARLPLPMIGIGLIVMLSHTYQNYALAGLVAAIFVATYALLSPMTSRLVDQYGQRKILPIATAISTSGLLLLTLFATLKLSPWLLFLGALLAGTMPSISAMIRARWTYLYEDKPLLQTAFSLESVLDELTFVLAPPLAIGLNLAIAPQAAIIFAALLLASGCICLLRFTNSEPAISPSTTNASARSRVITQTPVWLIALLFIFMGIIVGSIDIFSVAFSNAIDHPISASIILSAYALGSCIAGFFFGVIKVNYRLLPFLLLIGGLGTGLSTLLLFSGSTLTLAIAVFVAGAFFAPTMIIAMSIIEKVVDSERLTEGMTWLLAGLNIGVAIGAGSAGKVVEHFGELAAVYVACSSGAIVLLLSGMCYLLLKRRQ